MQHRAAGTRNSLLVNVRNPMGYEVPEYTFTGVADPLANLRRRKVPTTFVP
jgi:hypothetical protein